MSLEDNDQILKLKKTLDECNYNSSNKDCIIKDIMSVLNYKKKKNEAKFFLKTKNQDKIIMVFFPMSVELIYKSYNTPINIFFPKNYPNEPPQIFLEQAKGSVLNSHNYDVDPNTKQIMTYTLKHWSYDPKIESVMNEIYNSFKNIFPMYKESKKGPIYSMYPFVEKNNNYKVKLDIEQQISEIKYNIFNDYDIYKMSNIFKYMEIFENDEKIDYNNKKNILSNCPDCGSFIEILNETYNKIEFKCPICNKNDEKGVKTMFIEDYLLSICNNNKCNICNN
jgi:rubrerythrin